MVRQSRIWTTIPPGVRYSLIALAIGWLAVAVGGGSSRADMIQLVLVRVVTAGALGAFLFFIPREVLRAVRTPMLFLLAMAILVALQLVPLPYGLWSSLPGREIYTEVVQAAGLGKIWHPLSLSPELTWNSLLTLLAPALFICGAGALNSDLRRLALIILLGTILLSGFLGLLQVAAGPSTPLRFYRISNLDSGVGLFANRNHQAVFLAMGIPIAGWLGGRISGKGRRAFGLAVTASSILFLLACVFASQSRMGSAIAILSLILTGLMWFSSAQRVSRTAILGILAAGVVTIGLAGLVLRQWSDSRLDQLGVHDDLRFVIFPQTIEAAKTFFPVGAGFGTFPQIFPRFETLNDLRPEYFNHTHIEPSQLLIEGGAFSAILALAFLGWYLFAVWLAWRRPSPSPTHGIPPARLCSILVALPLVGSLTDYPLRTPLMLCTFAFLVALLHALVSRPGREHRNQVLDGESLPS